MTDMQEKEMIEQAKAGDPKANYEMSQWAQQMSILEPDEPRWNSLAAKCLVDAAQGGYEPAKRMVEALISGKQEPVSADELSPFAADNTQPYTPPVTEAQPRVERGTTERSFYDQANEDDFYDDDGDFYDDDDEVPVESGFVSTMKKVGEVLKKGGMLAAASIGGLVSKLGSKREGRSAHSRPAAASEENRRSGGSARRGRSSTSGFSAWVEENWKVVRIVCVVICVVLAALIVILLVPSKDSAPEVTATPSPTAEPTPAPTQEPFPNEATKLEIETTPTLLYRPGDSDASAYLPASQSFTVIEPEAENLRQGPSGSDYPNVITRIAEGTQVTAYAKYQNAEGTVWYLINSGGIWGWMYGPSLG